MKAFPGMDIRAQYEGSWDDKFLVPFTGMDLRDYFAAKAMQGMATWDIKIMDKLATDFGEEPVKYLARNAYAIANAMMEARNATK